MYIIYYGTRKKLKIDKNLGVETCPNCGHNVEMVEAREKCHFHIFFIPLFFWTARRGKICPCCGIVEQQDKKTYKSLAK